MLVTFWNKRGRGLIGLFGQIGHTTSSSAARAIYWLQTLHGRHRAAAFMLLFAMRCQIGNTGVFVFSLFFWTDNKKYEDFSAIRMSGVFFKRVMWFLFQPRTSLTTTMTCYFAKWERWSAHVSHTSRRSPIFPLFVVFCWCQCESVTN